MNDVLKILERDTRTTPAQIAAMTGRTTEDVEAIIREAEQKGILRGYKAVINWERAGEEQVFALIEVKVMPQRDVGFDAIAQRIARYNEVRSVALVSGGFDLNVVVVGRTMQEVSNFVSSKLAALEPVRGTETHFLLKRYKEDGVILDGEDMPQRLPVAP